MNTDKLQQTLDAMQQSGMVIVGREHIKGLLANDDRKPTELIPVLMSVGRNNGIHFYQDQAKFNRFEFAKKLSELGFDKDTAQIVIANLRPAPTPELASLGDRD